MIDLTQEARQLAASLELLSHGCVASLQPGRGHPDSRPPTGDVNPPHLQFLRAWLCACGPVTRQQVISHWRGVLKAHKGQKSLSANVKGETTAQEERRMIRDGEGWTVREVALCFRCTETRVRRVRRMAGLDEDTGKDHIGDRVELARRLKAQGKSAREIAFELRWSKSSVHRAWQAESA